MSDLTQAGRYMRFAGDLDHYVSIESMVEAYEEEARRSPGDESVAAALNFCRALLACAQEFAP